MTTIHNKAVRDKIPEIIEETGRTPIVNNLSDEEVLQHLETKLFEELDEYSESKSIEELADLIEVIYRITELKGSTIEDLTKIRLEKKEKRGAFDKNLFLVQVDTGTK